MIHAHLTWKLVINFKYKHFFPSVTFLGIYLSLKRVITSQDKQNDETFYSRALLKLNKHGTTTGTDNTQVNDNKIDQIRRWLLLKICLIIYSFQIH